MIKNDFKKLKITNWLLLPLIMIICFMCSIWGINLNRELKDESNPDPINVYSEHLASQFAVLSPDTDDSWYRNQTYSLSEWYYYALMLDLNELTAEANSGGDLYETLFESANFPTTSLIHLQMEMEFFAYDEDEGIDDSSSTYLIYRLNYVSGELKELDLIISCDWGDYTVLKISEYNGSYSYVSNFDYSYKTIEYLNILEDYNYVGTDYLQSVSTGKYFSSKYSTNSGSSWTNQTTNIDSDESNACFWLLNNTLAKMTYDEIRNSADTEAPVLSPSDVYFVTTVDSPLSFSALTSQVSAYDATEGDLTNNIVFSNNTYVLDAAGKIATGTYSFVATVSDSSGNKATKTYYVRVVDAIAPTITGTTKTQPNNSKLSTTELKALFTATDNYTASSSLTIEILSDEYSSNYAKPGTYEVTAKAIDAAGNVSTTATATITVVDKTVPTITGTTKTQPNNSKLSTTELKALFTATDDVTVSSSLTIEILSDEYSSNYAKPGTYKVTAKATDAAGNVSTTATTTITVIDKTKPTVSGTTKTQSYTTKLTDAEIKALFTYSDDVTSNASLTVTITSTEYTNNYAKPGTYIISCVVVDQNGNSATADSTISVIDDRAPIITVPNNLRANTLYPVTFELLKSLVIVEDAVDGKITNFNLADNNNYLNNTNVAGEYIFTVTASDTAGNEVTIDMTLTVIDTDIPELTEDTTYTIVVDQGENLTEEEILNILIASGQLESIASVSEVESLYFETDEAGEYSLSVTTTDGKVLKNKILVNAVETPSDDVEDDFFENKWNYLYIALGAIVIIGVAVLIIKKRK